jgi:hypothetical protein
MGVRLNGAAHREELRWLGLTLGGLALAIAFEHFVIHREVIQPVMQTSGQVPPWMWGALFLPEMAVCVVAGWRIRSLTWLAVYGAAGGFLREAVFHAFALSPQDGHAEAALSPGISFGRGALLVGIVYFLILGLASMTSREPGPVPNR